MKRNLSLVLAALTISVSALAKPPVPDVKLAPIAVTGKSGKFNVYKIEPKDDLDALKYFSGNTVYKPEELVKLLPIIEAKDRAENHLTCEYLCADANGNIVGRVRIYVDGPAK